MNQKDKINIFSNNQNQKGIEQNKKKEETNNNVTNKKENINKIEEKI